jgi:hypothetical protein
MAETDKVVSLQAWREAKAIEENLQENRKECFAFGKLCFAEATSFAFGKPMATEGNKTFTRTIPTLRREQLAKSNNISWQLAKAVGKTCPDLSGYDLTA